MQCTWHGDLTSRCTRPVQVKWIIADDEDETKPPTLLVSLSCSGKAKVKTRVVSPLCCSTADPQQLHRFVPPCDAVALEQMLVPRCTAMQASQQ